MRRLIKTCKSVKCVKCVFYKFLAFSLLERLCVVFAEKKVIERSLTFKNHPITRFSLKYY